MSQPKSALPDQGQKIVAIGDIHGDFEAFKVILLARNIIDADDNWIAGNTALVLMGDLVNKGLQSKKVMDFTLYLEEQAASAGGQVHSLLGNHEIILTSGHTGHTARADLESFGRRGDLRRAFQVGSPYADWIYRRNTMIQIGSTLFVHAGLEGNSLDHSPAEINLMTRAWVAYLQKRSSHAPPSENKWVISERGPLYSRIFKEKLKSSSKNKDHQKALNSYLQDLGVQRVVVGHSVTPERSILLSHPAYGKQVIMIDTGISLGPEGRISAIEILGDAVQDFYFERPAEGRCLDVLTSSSTTLESL